MNWNTISFDWNQVRAFLATVEEGSLSAAARALRQTQPTLSRQVSALEQDLGVVLFERSPRNLSLTQAGLELYEHVREMGEAAARISITATGQSQAIEGQVVITASDLLSAYYLPPILAKLRDMAPGIEIMIVACNDIRDLRRREADIAVRHVCSNQPDLIEKKIADCNANLYASKDYLDAHGRPDTLADLADAIIIGYGNNEELISQWNAMGIKICKQNIKLSCSNGNVVWDMVKHGLGMTMMAEKIADMTPGIEKVLPAFPSVSFPIWLTTHRELHTSRRIRLVYDLLAGELANS